MKLQYIGRILLGGPQDDAHNPRLWNLILPGHTHHLSTISKDTLAALGFIKGEN